MTGSDLITKYDIRDRLSDVLESGYSDEELLAYLNDALNYIWHVLLHDKYWEVIGDYTFTKDGEALPTDWYKATNLAPIIPTRDTSGNLIAHVYGTLPYTCRYYKKPQLLTALTDTIPGDVPLQNTMILDLLAQMTVILAMVNHGFDMTTEENLVLANLKMLM